MPQVPRLVHDTTSNKSSYFSLSAGIDHEFNVFNVFDKNDELDITPSLVLNAGDDKLTITHTNAAYNNLIKNSRRKRTNTATSNQKFQLQSVAAALDMTYTIGKFFVQPALYADYYLPTTTSKRLTLIYSLTIGLSF